MIYLMRHGESTVNLERMIACKRHEGDLTPLGREQANKAAKWLQDKHITAIYSSPFHRAEQTAHIIGDHLNVSVTLDDDLSEINCGDLDECKDDDSWRRWNAVYDRWMENHLDARYPNGESLRESYQRFVRAFRHGGHRTDKSVLLVTHGDIARCIVPMACINAAALQRITVLDNTGIAILEPYGHGRYICNAWNILEHLKGLPI